MAKGKKQQWYTDVIQPRNIVEDGESLQDYWLAPACEGELAYTWSDKPHRLIYDLIAYCMYLENERNILEEQINTLEHMATR